MSASRRLLSSALLFVALASAGACSGAPSGPASDPAAPDAAAPPAFRTQPGFQPGVTPPCLVHQTEPPTVAYQGGPQSKPVPQLTFLAYYTAAGRQPFCDGAAASDTDRVWAQLYARLTTNADNVRTILG